MKIKLHSVERILQTLVIALVMIMAGIILVLHPTYVCKETANFCLTYIMHIGLVCAIPLAIVKLRIEYAKCKVVDNS
jgi:hypothetical protein